MIRQLLLTALTVSAAVLAAACGEDTADSDDGGADASPTPARRIVDAPIDEAELIIRESFPPQYAVRVLSGIPDGCHEFHDITTTRTGTTIEIRVTNTVIADPDVACTAIYGTHEEVVELGSDFDRGVTYTVRVGDKTLTFVGEGTDIPDSGTP